MMVLHEVVCVAFIMRKKADDGSLDILDGGDGGIRHRHT